MKHLLLVVSIVLSFVQKETNNETLTINTNGFNNDKGKAVIFLFRKNDAIPDEPFKKISVEIINKKAIVLVENLPYDDYALIVLHDENDNEKIDHSVGLPYEQLGYSNNWALGFFTGMPTFEKLKFEFSNTKMIQNISITFKKNKK